MPQNPFDRGYAAIYAAWRAWPPLMALVRVGNIQNLQAPGYSAMVKDNPGAADRPELKVLENSFGLKPFSVNSRAVDLAATYPIHVSSGQSGISKINLLVIAVAQALTNAGPQLSISDILVNWQLQGDAPVRSRDIQARRPEWMAVATVRMEFKIDRAQFLTDIYT